VIAQDAASLPLVTSGYLLLALTLIPQPADIFPSRAFASSNVRLYFRGFVSRASDTGLGEHERSSSENGHGFIHSASFAGELANPTPFRRELTIFLHFPANRDLIRARSHLRIFNYADSGEECAVGAYNASS
jgi:hypothetical protein